jgi:hypothetical protein
MHVRDAPDVEIEHDPDFEALGVGETFRVTTDNSRWLKLSTRRGSGGRCRRRSCST